MHLGHQSVLNDLLVWASAHGLPAVAIVFEPQPREFFAGTQAPARLTRLREKLTLLGQAGVRRVLCLRFDAALAAWPAVAFVERVLVAGLGARAVLIGDDFRFGSDRTGDLELLARLGRQAGFEVRAAGTYIVDGERVSSSLVRDRLAAGDIDGARRLLGRHYAMEGRVVRGERRGRTIGYPTLNIEPQRLKSAVHGIFAARVHGLGERPLAGMAYVGTRPVVNGDRVLLEAHLFDFDGDCYGRHVQVEFVRKLREDRPFESLAALAAQLRIDETDARLALAGHPGQT